MLVSASTTGRDTLLGIDVSDCSVWGRGGEQRRMYKTAAKFLVGSARCRKDSAEIVTCTFGEKLNDDLKHLKDVGVLEFFQKGGGGNLFQNG
jgi:hypothetical protein